MLSDKIKKLAEYIVDFKNVESQKINDSLRRSINKKLRQFNDYFYRIPLEQIFNILESFDIIPIQEDGTRWSGLLVGEDGKASINLTIKQGDAYKLIANSTLNITWHKMSESKRFEIVVYVS